MKRVLGVAVVSAACACACATAARQPASTQPPPPAAPSAPSAAAPAAPASPPNANITEDPLREDRHLRAIQQLTLDGFACVGPRPNADGTLLAYATQPAPGAPWRVALMTADGRSVPAPAFPGPALDPAFTPTGALLVSTAATAAGSWEDGLDLVSAPVTGADAPSVLVAQPGADISPLQLPDGALLYVHRDTAGESLRLRQPDGTTRTLTQGSAPTVSPDGTRVVFRRFSSDGLTAELYEITLATGTERQLTALGVMSWSPSFHPGGTRVVFASNARPNTRVPGNNFDLYVLDLRTTRVERITYADGPDSTPAFGPDGHTLYWTSARQGGRNQVFAATWMD